MTILEEQAVFGLGIVKSITVCANIFWGYLSMFYLVPLASGQLVLELVRLSKTTWAGALIVIAHCRFPTLLKR